ncbi:helix-turn-helix transcriptional regulator [Domibacillus sp. A3M-37]|nr:helix-turn-helix transcriptional regulator [Domibacillus sp. A3M-37]
MYERNERKPDYETLQKFAEHFSVSIDYLITGKKAMPLQVIYPMMTKK